MSASISSAEGRRRAITVLRAIVHEVRTERVTFLAGSVAYNAFLSLLPLLLLVLAVVGSVGARSLEQALVTIVQAAITPAASEVLIQELEEASLSVSVLGVLILVWGALRIFRSLDTAFSDIYDTEGRNPLGDQLADGILVFGTLLLLVMGVLAVEARIDVTTASRTSWLFGRAAVWAFVTVALVPMFYLFPDESHLRVREVLPGTVFASTGLFALQTVFGIYLEVGGPRASNSVLASVIVLLVWLYFSSLIVIVGGAVNAVLTNRSNQVSIRPVIGGTSPSSPATSSALPIEPLGRLGDELVEMESLTLSTDGGTYTLPSPDRVDTDTDVSSVPFVNDTASITLHWRPDRSAGESDAAAE